MSVNICPKQRKVKAEMDVSFVIVWHWPGRPAVGTKVEIQVWEVSRILTYKCTVEKSHTNALASAVPTIFNLLNLNVISNLKMEGSHQFRLFSWKEVRHLSSCKWIFQHCSPNYIFPAILNIFVVTLRYKKHIIPLFLKLNCNGCKDQSLSLDFW